MDTGLLYRAVALNLWRWGGDAANEFEALRACDELNLDAADPELRSEPVSRIASRVSAYKSVRDALLERQRQFAGQPGGAVLDGRDIGTRICPDADVKIFITADPAIRARRRAEQLRARGLPADEPAILAQILARDEADRDNPAGAFYRAEDAHLLDTSQLDIEAAFRAALGIVERTIARKDGRKT